MRITWISGRNLSLDLAATTEINLAESLVKCGAEVSLISPGVFTGGSFDHLEIKKIDFPGLNSISGARYISRKLKKNREGIGNADVILVDWRYVRSLRRFLQWVELPWMIIDRGPPAFKGPLNHLQKIFWRDGWKYAAEHASGGFVVSKKHGDFVSSLNKINLPIHVVPAGTSPNPFLPKKTLASEILKISYVGNLNERRGIRKILDLSEKMMQTDVRHCITLSGEGDMVSEIEEFSSTRENISYCGKKSREGVQKILAASHVGIMPMPEEPIWRISSPLKFAEYLAAGLAIIGPKHSGNDLGQRGIWNHLGGSEKWVDLAVSRICELDGRWGEVEEAAIKLSKDFQWDSIASDMLQFISDKV